MIENPRAHNSVVTFHGTCQFLLRGHTLFCASFRTQDLCLWDSGRLHCPTNRGPAFVGQWATPNFLILGRAGLPVDSSTLLYYNYVYCFLKPIQNVCLKNILKQMLKRVGDRGQLYLTPNLVQNQSTYYKDIVSIYCVFCLYLTTCIYINFSSYLTFCERHGYSWNDLDFPIFVSLTEKHANPLFSWLLRQS